MGFEFSQKLHLLCLISYILVGMDHHRLLNHSLCLQTQVRFFSCFDYQQINKEREGIHSKRETNIIPFSYILA